MKSRVHEATFGTAFVRVDLVNSQCDVRVVRDDANPDFPQRMRLHSIEQIEGAWLVQQGLAAVDPVAADIARALKFAGTVMRHHEKTARWQK